MTHGHSSALAQRPATTGFCRMYDLGLQLLPALVIAQSMIEKALLPFDPILSSVKMFPIANDTAHRSIPLKGQQRVNVIGHEEKKCDVPAKFGVIEFRGLK